MSWNSAVELSTKQRKFLRGLAHPLQPVVIVGQNGISDNLVTNLDQALEKHELVKVRFGEFKGRKQELTEDLRARTRSECAGIVGHVAILYRRQSDPERRTIRLPA